MKANKIYLERLKRNDFVDRTVYEKLNTVDSFKAMARALREVECVLSRAQLNSKLKKGCVPLYISKYDKDLYAVDFKKNIIHWNDTY